MKRKVAHLYSLSKEGYKIKPQNENIASEWDSRILFAESYDTKRDAKNERENYLNSLDEQEARRQRKDIIILSERIGE